MYLSLLNLLAVNFELGRAITAIAIIVLAAVILVWLLATRKRGGGFVLVEDFEAYKKQIEKEQKEQNKRIDDLIVKINGLNIPSPFDSSSLESSISSLKDDHNKKILDLDNRISGIKIPEVSVDTSALENTISSLKSDHDRKILDLDNRISGIKIPETTFDTSSLDSSIASLKTGQEENDKSLDEVAEALKSLEREKDMISSKEKSLEADIILIKNENEKLWAAVNDCKSTKTVVEAPKSKEDAILEGIAAKRSLINFSSIGEATESDKDDLKLIKGVGPFIEKKLNALGIWTFAQVGSFTEEDVESVTKAIEFFPGRITRDNWVSQANELKNK